VTAARLDDQTLAAFLDDALPPAERERVLSVMAADPEAYADLLEAAQVIDALNRPVAIDDAQRAKRRWWPRPLLVAVPLLAAAGLAGVLLLNDTGATSDVVALMQGARLAVNGGTGSVSAALGEDWDQPGWSVMRGSGASGSSPGAAARIGARMAQLEYAASAGDQAAYARISAIVVALLSAVEGAGPIAARLPTLPMAAADERGTLARQLRSITGAETAFDVGVWLETARLADASGHSAFLSDSGAAVSRLRSITSELERAPPEGDWTTILAQLQAIARDAGDGSGARVHVDTALAAIPR
jgi:hypothetical protein